MVNPELSSYITASRKSGLSDAQIRQALIAAGWGGPDIDAALAPLQTPAVSPAASPMASPSQPATARDLAEPAPRRSSSKMIAALAVAIAILAFGGAALAYQMQWWPFKNTISDTDLIAHLADSINNIHSAVYSFTATMNSKDREAGTEPLSIAFTQFDAARAPYDRDNERFQWASLIQSELNNYYFAQKKYPAALGQLANRGTANSQLQYGYSNATTTDPLTGQEFAYHTTNGGSDYALTVTFETQDAVDDITNANQAISITGKSATFTKQGSFFYGMVSPKQPWFVSFFENQDTFVSFLPSDMSVSFNASGTSSNANSSVDTKFNLGTDVQFGDFAASAAVSFLKKADMFYVDVTKFPELFFDISPIKNKWVGFSINDLSGAGAVGVSFDPTQIQDFQTKQQDYLAQMKLTYVLAQQSGVIAATPIPSDADHKNLRGFSISVARDKVADFYKQAADQLHASYPNDTYLAFDQATYDYLKSQDFTDLFNYLAKNMTFTLWVDPATGFPAEFGTTFRFIPPASALKLQNTEFVLAMTLDLTNINQPADIAAPSPIISIDDAEYLLSGQPKDVYLYNKQLQNIESLRSALTTYKEYAGNYPATLDQLVITYQDASKLNPNPQKNSPYTSSLTYLNSLKILNAVPTDAYTHQEYTYNASNGDYTITYAVQTPTSTSTPSNPISFLAAGYNVVNGTNTATSLHFSVEGDRKHP